MTFKCDRCDMEWSSTMEHLVPEVCQETLYSVGSTEERVCGGQTYNTADDSMTDAMILQLIVEVLDSEIGRDISYLFMKKYPHNFDWQEWWEMSDDDYALVQEAVKRLKLA